MFQRARLDAQRDVVAAGEEEALPPAAGEQELPLRGREPEGLRDEPGRGAVLPHEELHRAVGEHGVALGRGQEVPHVLRDRGEAEPALARPARQLREEARPLGVAHQGPRLVDQEHARFRVALHPPPDVIGYEVGGEGAQLLLQALHVEDHEGTVERGRRALREDAAEAARDVALEAPREPVLIA